jgi:hypothetical protein
MLDVIDRQMMDLEHIEQEIVGLFVHPVEIEPEERSRRQVRPDCLLGGRSGSALEGQGSFHGKILAVGRRGYGDGR